jgi:hypothetical protein
MKILLGDFNAKLGTEDIFKLTTGNKRVCNDSNGNGVRIVNSATLKNLDVKSKIFPHQYINNTPGPHLMGRLTTRLITH